MRGVRRGTASTNSSSCAPQRASRPLAPGSLGEWFIDPLINPTFNAFSVFPPATQAVLLNDMGFPIPGGSLQVGATDLAQGSIVTLASPLVAGIGVQIEGVSRPLIEILPAAQRTVSPPPGGVITFQVTHNYVGGAGLPPLRKVVATLNGAVLTVTQTGGTTGTGATGPVPSPLVTPFSVTMPATIPAGAILRIQASEWLAPGGIPVVDAVNEVRF